MLHIYCWINFIIKYKRLFYFGLQLLILWQNAEGALHPWLISSKEKEDGILGHTNTQTDRQADRRTNIVFRSSGQFALQSIETSKETDRKWITANIRQTEKWNIRQKWMRQAKT